MRLLVNGEQREVDDSVPSVTPLLWVLREELGLTGTKFGCGRALCGACTVHIDGEPRRSCVTPLEAVGQSAVVTIEGLASDGELSVLQEAWLAENVPQCGYCQSGQLMTASSLLAKRPRPTEEEIDAAMSGNLCRCGTYSRIKKAIKRASGRGDQQ
ncbi:MAG: (2Fe-2S)-binding protein [Myxococcota bacterium]